MSLEHKIEMAQIHEMDFVTTVKKQLHYKIRAHHSMFGTMVIMQIIAFIFSFGSENWGVGTDNVTVHMNITSGNIIIVFTFIWAFIMAVMLTNKPMKSMMLTFVSTKQINHVSNFLFIIFLSVIGGVTAYLLGFLTKSITFLLNHPENMIFVERVTINEVILGMVATILYMFLISVIGYLIGEIVYLHKIFIVVLPVVIIGLFIIMHESAIAPIFTFFTGETNFIIFAGKILLVAPILFLIAFFLDRNVEVR